MKLLTTNSAGNDLFGGIHTRKTEQIKYSQNTKFHLVELNKEKKYVSKENLTIHHIDTAACTKGKGLFGTLHNSETLQEFNKGIETLVNEFQNIISDENPDVILIPGTSLTSYILFKAAKRENFLNKTVQEYAGVLEKEIGNYSGDQRYILGQIGKVFVSEIARENVSYIFPSKFCKDNVEEIHKVKLKKSHVIWNGICEEFLPGCIDRKAPRKLTLGYVGRVHHVKNLPFFLNLNDALKNKAKLKIITDLSSTYGKPTGKPLLEKLSRGEIFYYAPRSKSELSKFYSRELSASVVSSFFETYCNGALESIVSGTPCLLSDRAGAKEVFEKYGLDNLIYSIDNMESFEKALDYAKKMDFRIDMKLCWKIHEDLSWKKVLAKYNKVFDEVYSNNK